MSELERKTEIGKKEALVTHVVDLHVNHHDVGWTDQVMGKEMRAIFDWKEAKDSGQKGVLFVDVAKEGAPFKRNYYRVDLNTLTQEFLLAPTTNNSLMEETFTDQLRGQELTGGLEETSMEIDGISVYDILLQMEFVDGLPSTRDILSLRTPDSQAKDLLKGLKKQKPLLAAIVPLAFDLSKPDQKKRSDLLFRDTIAR